MGRCQRLKFQYTPADKLTLHKHGRSVNNYEDLGSQTLPALNRRIVQYSKKGRLDKARELFYELPLRNQQSWAGFIFSCVTHRRIDEARQLFEEMPVKTDSTYNAIFKGYLRNDRIDEAYSIFRAKRRKDVTEWNMMIAGFLGHGKLEDARNLFDEMTTRNAISYNTMISAYGKVGRVDDALSLFNDMVCKDVCSWTAIVSVLSQNGRLEEARKMFSRMPEKNIVSWNAMLAGYCNNSQVEDAHLLFERMPQKNTISWNTMISGFMQCGKVKEAELLLEKMPYRNVLSWTAMIKACMQNNQRDDALKLYAKMLRDGVKPDPIIFTELLKNCGSFSALDEVKQLHVHVLELGMQMERFVGSSLVNVYAKSGSIEDAKGVFNMLLERNIVSWNALIAGYAQHGMGKDALMMFEEMKISGIKPNEITFIGVLSACSHAGLMDEGLSHFRSMTEHYDVIPWKEHYTCMIDLFGRAGRLEEALEVVEKATCEPNSSMWGALFGACRIHGNTTLAKLAAEKIFELEPENAGRYMLLANIYSAKGRWKEAADIRLKMKSKGLKRMPGCSWITVKNRVHVFGVADGSHEESDQIYSMLNNLQSQMKKAGYKPDTSSALHDVEEEFKEDQVSKHSEKLAIAFALLHIPAGAIIRIFKNLRICNDCHVAAKFISKITQRTIVIRDTNRFHHFKNGICSCGDYW